MAVAVVPMFLERTLDIYTDDNPKPVVALDHAPLGGSRKTSAGTKIGCELCGRPTYRIMGTHYVCSLCTSKPQAKQFEMNW